MNIDAGLSDLFFNYEKPTLQNLLREADKDAPVDYFGDEAREALIADAKDFTVPLSMHTGRAYDPVELVDDFLKRV